VSPRVTLKTIASATGYSITTVSRALAGYQDVSPSTRQLIGDTAVKLGYFPNATARQLQKQRTDLIGLILPSFGPRFADPYFSLMLAGIGDEMAAHGYDVLISSHSPGPDELAAYRALVEGRRVDGTVVIRTRLRDERIAYLVERGFPFVAFGRTDDGLAFPYIDEDGESGTFQLVNHLAQLGHERIAYIAAPQELTFGVNRLRGYQRAMHEIGLSPNGDYVAVADLTRTGGMAAATRLLDLKVPPTAIVAANDLMALGAVTLAKDRKMVIGRDLSVAGFDDIPTAEALGLTTLSQPIYSIGRKLSRMLIALIRGEPLDEPKVLLQPRLVSRPSIGPPA